MTAIRITWPKWIAAAILFSLTVAGFFVVYDSAVRKNAYATAHTEAKRRADLEIETLVSDVEKFRILPFVLIELPEVRAAMFEGDPTAVSRLNKRLKTLASQTGASVIYGVDSAGTARAASNAGQPDSFIGHSFRFRPYFINAIGNGETEYFAEGSVTGRKGLFLARRAGPSEAPYGAIVVKIEFDKVERLWRSAGRLSFVTDRDGIIILATDPSLRFKTTMPLNERRRGEISRTRQFGQALLTDSGIRVLRNGSARDATGDNYIATTTQLPILGWRHVHLEPLKPITEDVNSRVRFATSSIALLILAFAGVFYWFATRQRRLQATRDALELEVERRTVQLSDVNAELKDQAAERERADRRYRTAREELAQANRLGSIGTITTSVAHEINQPVAAIRTAAENAAKLLKREQYPKVAENMRLIVDLTARIGTITGELLRYARRGKRSSNPVSVDDVIDGTLMLVSDSFKRAGVSLKVTRPKGLPMIEVSRIRAEQVLVNVLQNALDAVSGQNDGVVCLTVELIDSMTQIIVADNGPGISPELGETIFMPFVTGKNDGTGLGLGISREIVEEYGGTLEIISSPLRGGAFRITFPGNRKAAYDHAYR